MKPRCGFSTGRRRRLAAALCGLLGAAASAASAAPTGGAPATLAETGLYSDFARRVLAPDVLAFEPQYPLWSDGAAKRRWILLPPGTAIDASDPDVWVFPVGTKLWKEFAFGRPVETRLLERLADGTWRFAAYVWNAEGTQASLAPPRGLPAVVESAPGVPYDIPGTADCRACHGGHPATVLGFSALQLSPDRDPLAPHAVAPAAGAVDLQTLVARGLVTGLPEAIAAHPPRIAARSPVERAALGYLHGNCSHCHNARGPLADLGLSLAVGANGTPEALATALARAARYRPSGAPEATLVAAGDPAASLLVQRVASRQPLLQMPPLGTQTVDAEALALITRWIHDGLAPRRPVTRDLAALAAALPEEKKP